MKNFLFLAAFAINLFLVSNIFAQYNYPHQHNGNWHQHPHSAAHYHDYWGTITYYPPVTVYRGQGIWSYTPGAVVTPQRNVIIQYNGGYGYYYYPQCNRMPYRWWR